MFFKNIIAYHITAPVVLDDQDLETSLNQHKFKPCGSLDLSSMGFCSPFERARLTQNIFTKVDNRYWLSLKTQEKILPASVINDLVEEKCLKIEIESGHPVSKKVRNDLRSEVITLLSPKAFVKNSYTDGFISLEDNLVVVNTSSHAKAETFLALVRKALGSLPVIPFARHSLQIELTHWLQNKHDASIQLLEEAELKATDDTGSVVRVKNQPLDSEEVSLHLDSGKLVQKLAFEYEDVLSAVICEDGTFKKVAFTDRLKEETDDIPKDQVAQRLDAEFALASLEISKFLNKLKNVLGLLKE